MTDGRSYELRRCLIRGDQDAQRDLYELLRPLAALKPGFVEVAEFRNELHLRVVKQLLSAGAGTSLDEIDDLMAYARGIALNLRRVFLRRRRGEPRALLSDPPDPLPSEERSRQVDLAAALTAAIGNLPRRDREVFWLMDCQKLSAAETVTVLTRRGQSISVKAAYARLARARRALHKSLVGKGYRPRRVSRWLGLGAAVRTVLGPGYFLLTL